METKEGAAGGAAEDRNQPLQDLSRRSRNNLRANDGHQAASGSQRAAEGGMMEAAPVAAPNDASNDPPIGAPGIAPSDERGDPHSSDAAPDAAPGNADPQVRERAQHQERRVAARLQQQQALENLLRVYEANAGAEGGGGGRGQEEDEEQWFSGNDEHENDHDGEYDNDVAFLGAMEDEWHEEHESEDGEHDNNVAFLGAMEDEWEEAHRAEREARQEGDGRDHEIDAEDFDPEEIDEDAFSEEDLDFDGVDEMLMGDDVAGDFEFDDEDDEDDDYVDLEEEYSGRDGGAGGRREDVASTASFVIAQNLQVTRHEIETACSHHQCCDAIASSSPDDDDIITVFDDVALLYDLSSNKIKAAVNIGFAPYSIAKHGPLFAAGGDGRVVIFCITKMSSAEGPAFDMAQVAAFEIPRTRTRGQPPSFGSPMCNSLRFCLVAGKVRLVVGNQDGCVYFFNVPPPFASASLSCETSARSSSLGATSASRDATSAWPIDAMGAPLLNLQQFFCQDLRAGVKNLSDISTVRQVRAGRSFRSLMPPSATDIVSPLLRAPVNYASVSPDGRFLAIIGDFNKVFLLDAVRGFSPTFVSSARVDECIPGLAQWDDVSISCQYAAWNASSNLLAVSCDSHPSVHVWSVAALVVGGDGDNGGNSGIEGNKGNEGNESNVNEGRAASASAASAPSVAAPSVHSSSPTTSGPTAVASLSHVASFGIGCELERGIQSPCLALQFDPVEDILFFLEQLAVLHVVDLRRPQTALQRVHLWQISRRIGPSVAFRGCFKGHANEAECIQTSCVAKFMWGWSRDFEALSAEADAAAAGDGGMEEAAGARRRPRLRPMFEIMSTGLLISMKHGVMVGTSESLLQIPRLRGWDTELHPFFPQQFKDACRLLLLASCPSRRSRAEDKFWLLPSELVLKMIHSMALPLCAWI